MRRSISRPRKANGQFKKATGSKRRSVRNPGKTTLRAAIYATNRARGSEHILAGTPLRKVKKTRGPMRKGGRGSLTTSFEAFVDGAWRKYSTRNYSVITSDKGLRELNESAAAVLARGSDEPRRNPGKAYEVYAGGLGIVYEGTSLATAKKHYTELVADSKAGRGPVAGESVALMLDGEPIKDFQGRNDRVENPDWAALHEKAKHHGRRAVAGAKRAHEWSKPHAAKAWEATKVGAKRAGAATKRGAKKAAPHVARGIRSVSERLDRWAAVENPAKRRTRRKARR